MERSVAGTVFADGKPRIVEHQGHQRRCRILAVDDLCLERGQAGLHRPFRRPARRRGVNIATFALGRDTQGGSAVALAGVDGDAPGVKQAKALKF
jgi:D-3-phosphoglycerate dehydrogenase